MVLGRLGHEVGNSLGNRVRLLLTVLMDAAFIVAVYLINFGAARLTEHVPPFDDIDKAITDALRVVMGAGTIGLVGLLVLRDLVLFGIEMVKSVRHG